MMLDPGSGPAGSAAVIEATGDSAWLAAMLDVERAISIAAGRVGLVDKAAAEEVARHCDPALFDVSELARGYAEQATPVIALVERLRALVEPWARPAVHPGVTSQDVVDTAAMLVARRALRPVMIDVATSATALAGLARRHRDTPILGRTLGQHAAVTSYGVICAARLVALDDAGSALVTVVRDRLAVQLGGPVGTLAAAGASGPRLVEEVAAELGLAEPVLAWHTTRGRIGELAAALGVLAGELAGVALDVVLLSSGDVGELSVANPGGSSSMPHKRNPSAAVLALAAAHRVPALVATLLAGMPQELQRATGHWQAEAGLLTDLIRAVGAVARQTGRTLTGLQVHTDVMAQAVHAFAVRTGGSADPGPAGLWVDRALAAHQAGERP
jgi:3-carboxy-cis,cis-muconate cycloisomerase